MNFHRILGSSQILSPEWFGGDAVFFFGYSKQSNRTWDMRHETWEMRDWPFRGSKMWKCKKCKAIIWFHRKRRSNIEDRANPSQPGGPSTEGPADSCYLILDLFIIAFQLNECSCFLYLLIYYVYIVVIWFYICFLRGWGLWWSKNLGCVRLFVLCFSCVGVGKESGSTCVWI